MLIAVVYVLINLLADLIVMLLVPKLREPRVTGRLRFLRSPRPARSALGIARVRRSLVAVFGPFVAPHAPTRAGRRAAQRAERRRPARHRLSRSRRAQPGPLRRPLGARAGGGRRTLLAYLLGLAIGLVAGYSRSLVDPLLMRTWT